MQAVPFILTT